MKGKILKAAGVFCLSVILCAGMSGCSGKGNDQTSASDVQTAKESGSDEDIETREAKEGGDENGIDGMAEDHEETADGREDSRGEAGNSDGMSDDSEEEGLFYDGADLSGRVVDFSDTGCTITPRTMVINEDGSMEGGIAAPGYESEETNIHITYVEDVVFQVIYFSMGAQAETAREDTDKNSIKKDTDVNIFGTCQDEKNWVADKVVITRWQ